MNIGVIGTSRISDMLIKTFKQDHQKVVAVYSRSLKKGQDFANKHQITSVYDKLEIFMQDQNIDVVYIASPNSLHVSQAKLALNHGKNVIIEKPICSNALELVELINLAHIKKLMLFEAMPTLHLPNYQIISSYLANIEPLKIVEVNYSQFSSQYALLKKGQLTNTFDPNYSGGTLMDIGIYGITFVVGLFGQPQEVHYFANKHNNIDTSGSIILRYKSFIATVTISKDSNGKRFAQICGEKGYLFVDSKPSRVASLAINYNGQDEKLENYQNNDNHYIYEVKDIISCFEKQNYALCDKYLQKSLDIMTTMDRLRQTANIVFTND